MIEYLNPIDIFLFAIVFICMYTDIRFKKIYNHFTFSGIILGVGFNFLYGGVPGIKSSLLGLLVGGLLLFIFYLAGGMGAGDVKFLAAVGAFKGMEFVFQATLYGVIAGGVFTIFYLLFKKKLLTTFINIWQLIYRTLTLKKLNVQFDGMEKIYIPYGFFLGLGVIFHWLNTNI